MTPTHYTLDQREGEFEFRKFSLEMNFLSWRRFNTRTTSHFHLNCRKSLSGRLFRSTRCVRIHRDVFANDQKLDAKQLSRAVLRVCEWSEKAHKKLLSFPPNSPNIEFNDVNFPFFSSFHFTRFHISLLFYVPTSHAFMWKISFIIV